MIVDAPERKRPAGFIWANPSKLGYLDEQLIRALNAVRSESQNLNARLKDVKARNRGTKPGPFKTPLFFAESVPVGLCLHQGSDKGMDLLRTFLEAQGMLEQWLTKNSYSNDLKRTLVAATGSKGDIKSWATKKRQTMERAFLSGKLGKDVKSFKGLEAELTLLREQVSKRAAIFKN